MANTSKATATDNTAAIKVSPIKVTTNSVQQVQTPQAQIIQTVQRVKTATVTLAPVTPTKNAIVVASPGQTAQVISSGGQVISGNQIVVTNASLAQQLATGKAQLTTVGGHQVVIRSTPTGSQIVHLNSTNSGIIVKGAVTSTKQQQGTSSYERC